MLKLFRKHGEFIRHVGVIVSGRSVAAVIGLIVTPIVARLFEPADFGTAASYLATAGVTATIASLRYEAALALPKEDKEAAEIAALAFRILPAFCVLLLLFIWIYEVAGAQWRPIELAGAWIWLLPVTVLAMGALDIQESWLARQRRFSAISRSVILDTSAGGIARIGFGYFLGSAPGGLIVGHLLGLAARLLSQGQSATKLFRDQVRSVDWIRLKSVAREYSDFARFNAPAGMLFSLGQNLPVLVFGVLFSPAMAGFFAMANRLSKLPVQIVSSSVRRVFLQKAATIQNSGRSLRRSFILTTVGLFALGTPPSLAVWLYGQPLLAWFLGARWHLAGQFLEITAPWLLAGWMAAPCNPVFIVLRRQESWLTLQVSVTVFRLSAFAIAYFLALNVSETLRLFVWFAVAGNLFIIATALMLIARHSPAGKQATTASLEDHS